MFKLWARTIKNNKPIMDTDVVDDSDETRTHKVFNALDEICRRFDLARPIWLDVNIREFQKNGRTRFRADNFINDIEFDYLEIRIMEDD